MSVADDMAKGAACQSCGVYFEREHGHPVVCATCWNEATPYERKGLGFVLATEKEL